MCRYTTVYFRTCNHNRRIRIETMPPCVEAVNNKQPCPDDGFTWPCADTVFLGYKCNHAICVQRDLLLKPQKK